MHDATAGNPLGMLELAADPADLLLAPEGAPLLVSARIAGAFLRRAHQLDDAWHLAAAATGFDESASAALPQAGARA